MKTEAIEYFKKIGVSPEIRDFLVDQPTMMEVEGEDYSLEYVKPSRRNWEALHRFSVVSEELEAGIRNEVYMGLVGAEATHAFNSFVANYDKSVKGIEILDNLKEVQDKLDVSRVDIIDQINDQILDIVKADDINSKRSDNLVKYCTLIPKDSAVKLLRDICTGQTTDSSGESKAICTLPNVDKYIANADFNKKKYSEFVKLFSGVLKQQEENISLLDWKLDMDVLNTISELFSSNIEPDQYEDFDEKNIYDVYEDALMDSIKESFELIK